jgi:2-methylaconitate cis-trans-isomerase PrpF
MLPTGHRREAIQDTEVSLVDIAMPLVVVEARALGKTGRETPDELEADTAFMAHIEAVRCEAGHRMGFGDVSERVVPKLAMVAPPGAGGHLASRYFTPWQCHPTYAVTGSIGVCAAAALSGTIASDVVVHDHRFPDMVVIEHPVGELQVALDLELTDGLLDLRSAGLVRTARKLLSGDVHIPYSTWPGQA